MLSVTEVLRLLAPDKQGKAMLWATYSLTWLPLAASAASVKSTVVTQDDSDFIPMRMKAYVTDNATPPVEVTGPQATFTLSIGSNSLMPDGTPLHIGAANVNATKGKGHEFEYPVIVARSTTMTALLTNLTATAMNVRIALFGIRIMAHNR